MQWLLPDLELSFCSFPPLFFPSGSVISPVLCRHPSLTYPRCLKMSVGLEIKPWLIKQCSNLCVVPTYHNKLFEFQAIYSLGQLSLPVCREVVWEHYCWIKWQCHIEWVLSTYISFTPIFVCYCVFPQWWGWKVVRAPNACKLLSVLITAIDYKYSWELNFSLWSGAVVTQPD